MAYSDALVPALSFMPYSKATSLGGSLCIVVACHVIHPTLHLDLSGNPLRAREKEGEKKLEGTGGETVGDWGSKPPLPSLL